jgi:hypothetical protein
MDGKVLSDDLVENFNRTRTPRSADNTVTWVTLVRGTFERPSVKVDKLDITSEPSSTSVFYESQILKNIPSHPLVVSFTTAKSIPITFSLRVAFQDLPSV